MLRKTLLTIICLIAVAISLTAKDTISVNTVDTDLDLSYEVDYHVKSSDDFGTGSVNLAHPDAWLFLDSIRPQTFLDEYAEKVTVNGQALDIKKNQISLENASIPYKKNYQVTNARVQVYRHGTVIIPQTSDSYNALTVYADKNFEGKSMEFKSGSRYTNLGEFNDAIVSFKLKRGYMATVAVEADGRGFSRVFIADSEDIEIPILPNVLSRKISCIAIFDWQWPNKKGWCSSGRNAYNEIDITESTWYYSWSADRPTFPNQEYVPIRQNKYWPSVSSIRSLENVTHLLGFNEPDRSDQANATVEEAINGWEELMATGLRLGSPAIADNLTWLYNFIDECDRREYRVDFVAVHAYWGGSGGAYNVLTNGKVDVTKWYNRLKEIHQRTGRPLWITEWNNGANWTNNGEPYWSSDPVQQQLQNEEILREVLQMLDTCSFVERYSIYNWVSDRKAIVEGEISQAQIDASTSLTQADLGNYVAGGWINQRLTPAGYTYRDRYPTFAYNPEFEVIPEAYNKPGAISIDDPALTPRADLDDKLLTEKKEINTTGKSVFSLTPFDPPAEYSIEVKTKINSAEGRGLDIEARSNKGKGFRVSLDSESMNWNTSLADSEYIESVENTDAHIYRFAVQSDKVHIYRDKEYIGTGNADYVKDVGNNDTETELTGNYGSDVIGEWAGPSLAGTGKPTDYGWTCSGSPNWVNANVNSSGAVRYMDVNASSDPRHTYKGSTYTGRLLTLRWDGSLGGTTYYYPVTLEADTPYEFSMISEHWNNGTIGALINVGISRTASASGVYESASFVTGAKQLLQENKLVFTSKEAGKYYLAFTGASSTMFAIGELSLKELTFESRLQLGKNYNGGSADFEIFYVTYQEGAFAPGDETSIANISDNDLKIYATGNQLIIESDFLISNVIVFNPLGQIYANHSLLGNRYAIQLPKGIYIVKIYSEQREVTKKIILQ